MKSTWSGTDTRGIAARGIAAWGIAAWGIAARGIAARGIAAWGIAAAAGFGLTACGAQNSEERARPVSERLNAMLAQAPDSGFTVALVQGDTLRLSPTTLAFYREQVYRPAWSDGRELTANGQAVRQTLAGSAADGLNPDHYGLPIVTTLIEALESKDGESRLDDEARARHVAELDLVLSEGWMRYATDLVRGTIDPEAVGRAWRIPRSTAPTESVLLAALHGEPAQVVDSMRPLSTQYRHLMSGLQRLRAIADSAAWMPLPDSIRVSEGDSSTAVMALRSRLASSEDLREAELARRGAARPAIYDADLREALQHFQRRHGLDDDGELGAGTMRELNHTLEERIAEIRLNLDRWRWLPAELGGLYVMVNIAGFELEMVERGKPIEAMNVVVGKEGWATPVFADTMEYVVVNPYWTPPESILEEEIYPAMERDPDYLARNDFEYTSDGVIRQRPGRSNALGRYKFMFPNDDNIYLHDTPAGHLFSRARRDFSHGCVRLERPDDLARLIVGTASEHPPADLDNILASGAEKWIKLSRPIPIYIVYFTTWADQSGALRFHHDVYGHDEDLDDARDGLRDSTPQRVVAVSAG